LSQLNNSKEQFIDISKLKPNDSSSISKKISKSFSNSSLIPFRKMKKSNSQENQSELHSKSETFLTPEKVKSIHKSHSDFNLDNIQRVTSENDLSSFGLLNFGFKSDFSSSLPDNNLISSFEENCKNCKRCVFLENKVDSLKTQLNWYASFFNMTPEVCRWLDEIKPKIEQPLNGNESFSKSKVELRENLISKSFRTYFKREEEKLKYPVIPKIKIDSWLQQE